MTKKNEPKQDDDKKKKKKHKPKQVKQDSLVMFNDSMKWIEQFKECNIADNEDKITSLPWVEKFRPKSLNDIVSHKTVVSTFKKFILKKRLPHMILRGPPGTGKTSVIMACAKELYGEHSPIMVLAINASEERGIEVVRNKITDFISTKGVFMSDEDKVTFKLVILDEADAMTADAQSMLVSVIEKFTSNVRFCLICNYIKKISPAIQSRCTVFKFSPLCDDDVEKRLKSISEHTKINITNDGVKLITKISKGDMRKVLNTIQTTNMVYDVINNENVTKCIGYPSSVNINKIYSSLINDNYTKCYKYINNIITYEGYSLSDIISEITDIIVEKFMNKKMSDESISSILVKLRDIEMNLSSCPNEQIQLSSFIGAFKY